MQEENKTVQSLEADFLKSDKALFQREILEPLWHKFEQECNGNDSAANFFGFLMCQIAPPTPVPQNVPRETQSLEDAACFHVDNNPHDVNVANWENRANDFIAGAKWQKQPAQTFAVTFAEGENDESKDTPEPKNDYVEMLKAVADILSRIWFHGGFKIETPNERVVAGLLNDLHLFPCTEDGILSRRTYNNFHEKYRNYQLPTQ